MIERADHAKRVCLTVLEALEQREGRSLSNLQWADQDERERETVDLSFECSTERFVLEHTRIESFAGQIEHTFQAQGWMGPLRSKLQGVLPAPGHYLLSLAPGAVKGHKPDEKMVGALARWVRARAGGLEIGSPETAPRHWVQEKPEGVPFEVTLTRWPHGNGELEFSDFVPDDLEGRRRLRIRLAFEAKLPKLQKSAVGGATTILALESDDIALANAWNVAVALMGELERLQAAVPDRVWLVETDSEPWLAWELKRGSEIFGANWKSGHFHIEPGIREELLLKWSLRFRQARWTRFSQWESGQARGARGDFGRALAWMWEAWQLARAQHPDWGRRDADDAHVRQLRAATEVLGKLKVPA